jgi:N-acetylneuraminate synthase
LKIANFEIGSKKTFIIAEIGNNHNGCFQTAIRMIDAAKNAGADCVKFQMRNMSSLYRKKTLLKEGEDLGTEYVIDLLEKFELTTEEHKNLSDYCNNNNILYMCTPWDNHSIDVLKEFDVKAYKVASADLTNIPLIRELVKTGKPLILSTGMSSEEEIMFTVNFLNDNHAEFALLHCNSTYPAPLHDINLHWISRLKEIHKLVGYSGHERGSFC